MTCTVIALWMSVSFSNLASWAIMKSMTGGLVRLPAQSRKYSFGGSE